MITLYSYNLLLTKTVQGNAPSTTAIINLTMKSTKVQTLGAIWLKYWNIWIENTFACICIR